jgi:hypothetical protein
MNPVARLSTGQSSDGENVGQLGTSAVPVTRMSTGQSSGGSVSGDEVGLHVANGESTSTAVRPISEVEEDSATGDGDGDTRVTAGASTIASTSPPPRTTTAMPRIVPVARQSTGLSSFSEGWADDEAEESLITGVAQQQEPASDSIAAAANRAGSDESTNSVFGEDMALQALVGGESAPAPTRGADAKGFRGTVRGMPVPRISTGLGSESCTDVDEPSTQPSVPEVDKAASTTSSSTTVATNANANANTNADGRVEDATVQTHAREDRREDAARADNDDVVVVEQQPTPTRSHSSKHERDIAADLSLTTGQFLVKYRTNAVVGLSLAESRLRLKT